jgi:sec-independent protein translocase protein TatC
MPKRLLPTGHDQRLSIVDHLDELRSRLIVCVSLLVVVFGVCFAESPHLLNLPNAPLGHLSQDSLNHI